MLKNTLIITSLAIALLICILSLQACSKSGDSNRIITPPVVPPPPVIPAPPVDTKKWIVSTIAGSGMQGAQDGDSTDASFYLPTEITVDATGNLFVSDVLNHVIRKITPDRHVSTYAGNSLSAPNPVFETMYGLAVNSQGILLDVEWSLVRKIISSTESSLFVGDPYNGYIDSTGGEARFNEINKLTIDKDDNLFLTDYDRTGHPQIRKVTPDGVVSTLALQDNTSYQDIDGPNHYYLFAIAVDRDGNLYKTSNGCRIIKKITPDGKVTVFAGEGTDARFNIISGMITDAEGNLFVADYGSNVIRKITKDGTVTTIAGTFDKGYADGEGSTAKFFYPSGITIDKNGVIYVAEAGNNRIRKLEYK